MESFAKSPEPVSFEPKLRLQALRTQLTKSLLAIYSPLPPVLRNKTVFTEKLVECATHINQDEHEMRIKRTLKTIRAMLCTKICQELRETSRRRPAPCAK